jgi:preprotein translocase subunit SecA
MAFLKTLFGNYSKRELKRVQPILNLVLALEDKYAAFTDEELKAQTPLLKARLANGETLDDILPDAFAAAREASWRVLGMKHFPVQIIGGIILHQGRIAEMRTGEGKTLVATLPAYLNALSEKGVHVVTVNDYLARRDSEWMGKLHRFMGLEVGLVVHDLENDERKAAYNADITYGTNNEYGFDYLRDNMVPYAENKVQRGHNFAIVDEVDSILIDEARTPLIISGQGDKSTDLYAHANVFAKRLHPVKVKETDDKQDNDALHTDADYIIDEKSKTCTLTPKGVEKAEAFFNVDNLMDPEHMTLLHHVNQAIKANGIMNRDVDYVVKDGEVIIVDEYTGRLMFGRRYNEGLHQAIEAKEGVKIERESKTLATITFQNYFRMYTKLSGMTGTAMTEEEEFREIYKLDVIDIPTNRPMVRADKNDVFYRTEQAKFNAVIERIIVAHEKGQPVLVGTVNIEKSEHLSKLLGRKGVKHEVLNAKFHEKEAEIVAQAGKKGAVTIATNMAGRGTDIMLGGNSEYMAKTEMRRLGYTDELISEATAFGDTDNAEIIEARAKFKELETSFKIDIKKDAGEVVEAGGLLILGTERHESRRIDNQLRGRAGRQGDPGESQFFLSAEDDLVRLFGGERIGTIMNSLNVEEDMPIDSKLITNMIESAQRKVESRNFAIRKDVLKFDEVMNRQREIIYNQRDKVLNNEDLTDSMQKMITGSVESIVEQYIPKGEVVENWNLEGLKDYYYGWLIKDELSFTEDEMDNLEPEYITKLITDKALSVYEQKREELGEEQFPKVEQWLLLKNVDTKWMDHIDAMEELKKGIYLRAYAQKDPVAMYTIEGFDMFDELNQSIREETVRMVLTIRIRKDEEVKREQVAKPTSTSADGTDNVNKTVRKKETKVGRNSPCPCGSGKKYKQCCGKDAE